MIIKYLIVVLFLVGCGTDGSSTDTIDSVQTCTIYTSVATGTTTEYCETDLSRIDPYIADDGSIER